MQVSVVIPTHNRPAALGRCIRSILQQTRSPDQIVIVNDASDSAYDEALNLIDRLQQETTITLSYNYLDTPQGAAGARNLGIEEATSDIIMFIDDDDTWTPVKIQNQLSILKSRPDIGLVYAGRNAVDTEGNMLYRIAPRFQGDASRRILQENVIGTTSSVAVRRKLFDKVGGFDENMPAKQDYDLWIRLCQHTAIAFDPEYTVNWTVHRKDASEQMAGKPVLYEEACKRIRRKYGSMLRELSEVERRRARSFELAGLADKYARISSPKQYTYAVQALLTWPTLAALSRLLPFGLWMYLRKLLKT